MKLINVIVRIFNAYRLFYINSNYLDNGRYLLLGDLRTFVRKDKTSREFVSNLIQQPNIKKIKKVFIWLIGVIGLSNLSKSKKDYHGTILYLSNSINSNRDIKVFDIERETVLTKYFSHCKFTFILDNINYFTNYFPVPELRIVDEKSRIIVERMVRSYPKENWSANDYLDCYEKILDAYYNYFTKAEINHDKLKSYLNNDIEEKDFIFIYEKLKENINLDLDNEIPIIFQHGDLSLLNILYVKDEGLKWIDFEHANSYPFYLDLMFCIVNEVIKYENSILLIHYYKGRWDEIYFKIFGLIDYEYSLNHKMDYIYLTLWGVLNRYLKDGGSYQGAESIISKFSKGIAELDSY